MKKVICLILSIIITALSTAAFAENKDDGKGVLDSINDAWQSLAEETGGAWEEVGDSAVALWESLVSAASETWSWTKDYFSGKYDEVLDGIPGFVDNMNVWLAETGVSALSVLKDAFDNVAAELDMKAEEVSALWNAIDDYAETNEIKKTDVIKLTLAALVQIDSDKADTDKPMSEKVIDWFNDNGITDQTTADAAIAALREALVSESE